jgi:hypothetical protein
MAVSAALTVRLYLETILEGIGEGFYAVDSSWREHFAAVEA